MDLIYADATKKDIGVLNAYEMDMAYGSDENNFECSIERNDHCCGQGFFIYVEGEEYGGIVDSIRVDTKQSRVTYCGRTWHGILQGKAICPDPDSDYVLLDGEANEVLQEIIDHIGLTDLFEASDEDSGIEISSYQMDRYCYAYDGIRKMLRDHDAKLKLAWIGGKVILSAVVRSDYSQDDEFDTSQVEFSIKANYRAVNHMICLGKGELRDRAVIHIFTDEFGGVQPYATIDEPLQDSDYILTEANQVMTGSDEVVEVLDKPNAEIVDNYILLDSQPEDWDTDCEKYFEYEPTTEVINNETVETGGKYKNVRMIAVGYLLQDNQPYDWTANFKSYYTYDSGTDRYSAVSGTTRYDLLSSKPGNWSKKYADYYYKDGNIYKSVSGVKTTSYIKQRKRPSDWKKNYSKYYYLYSDGVTTEYRSESAITKYEYKRQTQQPTDWLTNYSHYYRPVTAREIKEGETDKYKSVELTKKGEVPAWKPKKYYTKVSKSKAPAWGARTHYTKKEMVKAPTWSANTYYNKVGSAAPTWAADTYYTKTDLKVAPEWISGQYYYQVHDRYASMVEEALEKLAEYHASDELNINLTETEQVYDVGDLVGTTEQVTGIEATQEVIKKIIKINNDDIVIRYEVG